MRNMREFLGQGAREGQALDFWTAFGKAGDGKFTAVAADRLAVTAEISVPMYKGSVRVNLTITGPNHCKVELWGGGTHHVDDKATYKDVGNTREVYCALFPNLFDQVSVTFWRDRDYSNIKLWGKKLGIWAQLLHVWAHPTSAATETETAALFDAGLEPLRPSVPAVASVGS